MKLVAYVLDAKTLQIKDMLQYTDYTFKEDADFADKSTIVVTRKPNIKKDDYAVCMDGDKILFIGIFENQKPYNETGYTLTLTQMQAIFDADVIDHVQDMIRTTGIEDWLAQIIGKNWMQSGDDLLDKRYIRLGTRTHTKYPITVETQNGIFNLLEFLKDALRKYGLRLSFKFNQDVGSLDVSILKVPAEKINVDLQVSDVIESSEVHTYNILSRVMVAVEKYDQPGHYLVAPYYWLADGTITQEADDPRRVPGTFKTVSVNASEELPDDIRQAAEDAFKENLFEHKITAVIRKDTQLFNLDDLYIGRLVHVVTNQTETDSMVVGRTITEDNTITLVFGTYKTNLVEKMRTKK